MKKRKFVIILFTLFFILSMPVIVSARAGGGGGGGSSSSSSSSSSGSYNNSYYDNEGGFLRRCGPMGTVISFIIVFCLGFRNKILQFIKIFIKSREAKKIIDSASRNDERWNYNLIKARVDEAFYVVQESWSLRDASYAAAFTSKDLLENHNSKLQWMVCKHELNVLKNVELIQATPISAVYSINSEYDHIWFYIKGSMVDYTINDETSEIINGSTKSRVFSEYWKFIKENDVWVLDEIRQIDDNDISDFNSQYGNY